MSRSYERSRELFARAKRLMPGGVNSPARAFGAVGGTPIVLQKGEGSRVWDVDGNEYIDYVASWGPLILGHRHPAVVEAIERALACGTTFGAPTPWENELAELVVEAVPSIERVRFVNSGTEASMSAIRLARGYTGRNRIVKFAGCYHGHVDALLVQAGSSATTLGAPSSPGVPPGCTGDTLVLRYNDTEQLRDAFDRFGDEIAAVILEPIAGNMGVVPATEEFLHEARRLTAQHGSILIFDEVITGFRVAYGGAQSLLGLAPDLTVLGKIVGGGLPVGAFGGRADIMGALLPEGKVFQAGTLSGNPLAMAAGAATLRVLRETNPYGQLESVTARLCDGLERLALEHGLPAVVQRVGSMFTLFFSSEGVRDYEGARKCDTETFARYFWAMLDRGVYLPCSQFEANFVSVAHTEGDIEETLARARDAFEQLSDVAAPQTG